MALARGFAVRGLARAEWIGHPGIPLADRVLGRLPRFLPDDALRGCDAVVHCAVSTSEDEGVARAVNVDGTLALARAARDAGAGCFVFLSTQSARADTPSVYGRTKYEAERGLLADPSLHAVVLRPGLVCGDGGLFRRLAATVRRAPVVPLLAGDAPVQPIFVDDLVAAILRYVAEPGSYLGRTFELGLDEPLSLRRFVGLIATQSAPGKRIAPVPAAPVALAVRLSERIGIRLPVSSTNIVGAREVRRMDTAASNTALGVPARSADEIVRLALAGPADPAPAVLPMRTVLIGTGRIGIVHAVTLSRLPGIFLAGMLDRRPAAFRLLRSVGIRAPGATSDPEGARYDAAVIATPPATHAALASARVGRGERILIEKPAARALSDVPALEQLADAAGERALVGYLMPRMPHLRPWLARLRAGELGAVRSFAGFALLSLIDARSGPRWETTRAASGGGVLVNSGTHVLSLIHAAFGAPRSTRTEILSRYSSEVEDCSVVHLDYGAFSGTHVASWCIPGFSRQENRLIVETERGTLTLSSTMAVFESGGSLTIEHQLDHDVGFNLAPDYAGGGIAAELRELAGHRFEGADAAPMTLRRALDVERLLFALYAQASTVSTFTAGASTPVRGEHAVPVGPETYLDIRDAPPAVIAAARAARPTGLLARTVQLRDLHAEDVVLTVPDFLAYTRLITDRQRAELLRRFGGTGLAAAARIGAMGVARERAVGFWPVAAALLSGELSLIPSDFRGTLLLHPYLADLAIALDRLPVLQGLIDQLRGRRHARVGVHSNLGREAANAMLLLARPPDALSLLISPNGSDLSAVRGWLATDGRTRNMQLIAEVGPGPLLAHRVALRDRGRWAPPDIPLVVNAAAVCDDDERAVEWKATWSSTFPGLDAPPLGWVQ